MFEISQEPGQGAAIYFFVDAGVAVANRAMQVDQHGKVNPLRIYQSNVSEFSPRSLYFGVFFDERPAR